MEGRGEKIRQLNALWQGNAEWADWFRGQAKTYRATLRASNAEVN